ncbi:hypothetical protein [Mesorhizobium sp. Pch-S]|uniref:hypothetical protein n=1 Tax=Mesorhizobium sp. Pch-S TaxID=2082387 RepID=UPI001013A4B3|nr:hypothetical protein [Mesorhizobium sp. Pch-S]QAZ46752.1 hypothetical protein C1M53_31355 [Mesorhizobium sp. Pch-S]
MDRSKFYESLRARNSGVFGTSLSQTQVNGTEALLNEGQSIGLPLRQLAYVLATAYHETARTMLPIEEYGKGKGRPYGKPAGPYDKIYFGRGFVQLTWLENYQHAGEVLGINLVKFPEKALDLDIASEILFRGMMEGWFTRKKLSDYISGDKADYVNARRIVNGMDKAELIAGYAKAFETALRAAGYIGQAPKTLLTPAEKPAETVVVTPAAPQSPPPEPAPQASTPPVKRSLLQIILDIIFRRKGA